MRQTQKAEMLRNLDSSIARVSPSYNWTLTPEHHMRVRTSRLLAPRRIRYLYHNLVFEYPRTMYAELLPEQRKARKH